MTGDYPAATASLTRALELSRDLDDQRGQTWALHDLGVVQEPDWDYPAATASLTRALELSRDLGDQRGQAWALNHLGVVQRVTGDYPAATASSTRALELFGDLVDQRGQTWALNTTWAQGAAADRGLPGLDRQPSSRALHADRSATWATGAAGPWPSTSWAWCRA